MKSLYLSDIKDYVKARLDELSNNEDALLVANSQAVQDIDKEIEKAVVPSVRKIHLDAPNVLLRDGEAIDKDSWPYVEIVDINETGGQIIVDPKTITFTPEGGSQNFTVQAEGEWSVSADEGLAEKRYEEGIYKYVMRIPRDFLRLVTLQMNDWARPIQTLINEDSAEYHKQRNKYLCGTWERPIGVIVHRQPNYDFIELYSCRSTVATIMYGQYVPEPRIISTTIGDMVYICYPLEYPCLNQITAEVLRGIGRHQEAALYDAKAVQPFYIDPDYTRLNPPLGERFNTTIK